MKDFLSLKKITDSIILPFATFISFIKKKGFAFWVLFFLILNGILGASFIILIILLNSQSSGMYSPEMSAPVTFSYFESRPDLYSTSNALVIYNATKEEILLSKNENLRFSPASTAKIISALVVLDYFNLHDTLVYPRPLVGNDSSKMGLFINEEMTIQNLLYGMMLPSGNDAAQLLAINYPGSEKGFVEAMNQKAKELGLENTHFVDPAGYEDENYSTAYDLVKLGAEALKNETFSNIVKTRQITVTDTTGTIPHMLKNLNELLSIQGVTGIKTGFTNEAGGVLVTSFTQGDNTYIMVVLRSEDRFEDTRDLIQGIIKDLKNESISL